MRLGLFLLALLAALLWTPFSVRLRLYLEDTAFEASVELGLGPYFFSLPPRITSGMGRMLGRRDFRTREGLRSTLKLGWRLFDDFFQKIESLQLKIALGLGDPLWTSWGYAGIWSVLGALLTSLQSWGRLESVPTILILPEYAAPKLLLSLNCIFHFRVGQIIIKELKKAL